MSEHGRANALDIKGFVTAQSLETGPLADWGMTERDIRAVVAAQLAADKAAAERRVASANAQPATADPQTKVAKLEKAGEETSPPAAVAGLAAAGALKNPFGQRLDTIIEGLAPVAEAPRADTGRGVAAFAFSAPSRLGGPKPQGADSPKILDASTAKALFLRAAHNSACQRFGTVLGPEANDDHRNHFHLDMAERPIRRICE
jgi:hypothetical protein